MDYRKVFDYNEIRRQITKQFPDLVRKAGIPTDEHIDSIIKNQIDDPVIWAKYTKTPGKALQGHYKQLGEQIDTFVSKNQRKKSIFEQALSYPVSPSGAPVLPNEERDVKDLLPPDKYKEIEPLIQERNLLRRALGHGTGAGGLGDILQESGIGNRTFKPGREVITDEKGNVLGEKPTTLVRTHGLANIPAGLAKTTLYGHSFGLDADLPFGFKLTGMSPSSDEEAVQTINYLREVNPWYREVFKHEVKQLDRNTFEKALDTAAYVTGASTEFKAAAAMTAPLKALAAIENIAKIPGASKIINNFAKIAAKSDNSGKAMRKLISVAAHSADSAVQFAMHSFITGRPQDAISSAVTGMAVGAGGRILGGGKVVGEGVKGYGKGAIGGGLGFAVPMSVSDLLHGHAIDPDAFATHFIAGAGLWHTKFPKQYVGELKNLSDYNQYLKYTTGEDILGESTNKIDGYKRLRAIRNQIQERSELASWDDILGLKTEEDPAIKEAVVDEPTVKETEIKETEGKTETIEDVEKSIFQSKENYEDISSDQGLLYNAKKTSGTQDKVEITGSSIYHAAKLLDTLHKDDVIKIANSNDYYQVEGDKDLFLVGYNIGEDFKISKTNKKYSIDSDDARDIMAIGKVERFSGIDQKENIIKAKPEQESAPVEQTENIATNEPEQSIEVKPAKKQQSGVTRIISGGQTGADFGGLEAGKELGIQTGGTAPKGYKTESGQNPKLKEYGLQEDTSSGYVDRTMRNVDDADGTIAFRLKPSVGTDKTIGYAQTGKWQAGSIESKNDGHRPVLVLTKDMTRPEMVTLIQDFVKQNNIETLNIAGHRESGVPGLAKSVKETLVEALKEPLSDKEIIDKVDTYELSREYIQLIDTGRNTEVDGSSVGKINEFIDTIVSSESYNTEQKKNLLKYIRTTAMEVKSGNEYVRKMKAHLGSKFTDIHNEFIKENGTAVLKQIYHSQIDRKPYGSEGQFGHKTISFTYDSKNKTFNVRIDDTSKVDPGFNDMEYTSNMSEMLGSAVSYFDGFVEKGKRKPISEVTDFQLKGISNAIREQGKFLLPFRSDSGKGFIVEPHKNLMNSEIAKHAYEVLNKEGIFADDIIQEYSIELKLPVDGARRIFIKDAINTHLYLQDMLGENYIEHMKSSGQLGDIMNLTKRMQIPSAKGMKHESASFTDLPDIKVVDGVAKLRSIVVPDHPEVERTDGRCPVRPRVFDRLTEIGIESKFVIDPKTNEPVTMDIANLKSFVYHKDKEQGALLGKLKLVRATNEELKRMDELDVDFMFYDSAAKYRGARKMNEVFEIEPESIRTMGWEHFDYVDDAGKPIPTYVPMFRQIVYYAEDHFIQNIQANAIKMLEDEVAKATTDKKYFNEWFKTKVMKRFQEVTGEEDVEDIQTLEKSPAIKLYDAFGFSEIGSQIPWVKPYTRAAIYNYLSKSVLSPHLRGHIVYFDGLPDWADKIIKNDNEVIYGEHAKWIKIDDLIKAGSLDAETKDGKPIKDRSLKTLGDLYEKYPGARVLLASVRPPVEDIGGVRSQVLVGLGGKGTGSNYYCRKREMNLQGGADNDIDKATFYLEHGKEWRRILNEKYNNSNYLVEANAEAEAKIQAGNKDTRQQGLSSIYNTFSHLRAGKSILNAKSAIGRLMAMDRTIRTLAARDTEIEIPSTELKGIEEISFMKLGDKQKEYKLPENVPDWYKEALLSKPHMSKRKAVYEFQQKQLKENPEIIKEIRTEINKLSNEEKLDRAIAFLSKKSPRLFKSAKNIIKMTENEAKLSGMHPNRQGEFDPWSEMIWIRIHDKPRSYTSYVETLAHELRHAYDFKRNKDIEYKKTEENAMPFGKSAIISSINYEIANRKNLSEEVKNQKKQNVTRFKKVKFPAGEAYDAKMKYYKKAVVDAKHGGMEEWDVVQRKIINELLGDERAADVVLGVRNKITGKYEVEPHRGFIETNDMFSKVFSKNFKEGRQWTPDERTETIKNYFAARKPVTQLEKAISGIPDYQPNLLKSTSVKNVIAKLHKTGLPSGGELLGKLLQDNGLDSIDKINKAQLSKTLIDKVFAEFTKNSRPNYDTVKKKGENVVQYVKERQRRAIDRMKKLADRLEIDYEESADGNQQAEYLIEAIRPQLDQVTVKEILKDMYVKANDFIPNDVQSIISKEMEQKFGRALTEEQRKEIAVPLNNARSMSTKANKNKIFGNKRVAINKAIDAELQKVVDLMKKNRDNKAYQDYAGVQLVGSLYQPEFNNYDSTHKMDWVKWLGADFLKRYANRINKLYEEELTIDKKYTPEKKKQKTEDKTNDPVQTTTEQQAVSEVAENTESQTTTETNKSTTKEVKLTKSEAAKNREIAIAEQVFSKLSGSKYAANEKDIRIAKKALSKLVNNPFRTWQSGMEFAQAVIKRPDAKFYNFTKYPLDKIEIKTIIEKAREFDRGINLLNAGNPEAIIKMMYKTATPSTISQSTPWTYSWFRSIVNITDKIEARFSELRRQADEIVAKTYEEIGDLERAGKIVHDIQLGKTKEEVIKANNLTDHEYEFFSSNEMSDRTVSFFNSGWTWVLHGHKAYLRNTKRKLLKAGIPKVKVDQYIDAMKLKKIDRYFPRYVENLEGILADKAGDLVDKMISNEISPKEIKQAFETMHTRKRTKAKNEKIEYNLEKVLHTYLNKTMPWVQRQLYEEATNIMMDRFTYEISKSPKHLQKPLEDMQVYFTKLGDHIMGRTEKVMDPVIVKGVAKWNLKDNTITKLLPGYNDTGTYFMKYVTPDGTIEYKDLETADQELANIRYLKLKMDRGNNFVTNMSNGLLGWSFFKNIGFNISSSVRNQFQKIFPLWMTQAKDIKSLYHDTQGRLFLDKTGNEIDSYKKILDDAFKQAGLTFGQTSGESGEVFENISIAEKISNELSERIYTTAMGKAGTKAIKFSQDFRDWMSSLAQVSSTAEIKRKGKTYGLPLRNIYAFSKVETGHRFANRPFAFSLGFHPVFNHYYDLYRIKGGLDIKESIEMAKKKAIPAGVAMVELTQFDYHNYNTPEIMREFGIKGQGLKQLLQFKKYQVMYYKMIKKVLYDARDEFKSNKFGDNKIINKQIGTAAGMLATHATLLALTKLIGLGFYNYVQDDMSHYLWNTWKWLTGDDVDYITQKETPIPYMLGPNMGDITSLGLIMAGIGDNDFKDWMIYHAAPRGPRKVIQGAYTYATHRSAETAVMQGLKIHGLSREFSNKKKKKFN